MVSAVIFDMDGVLIDSEPLWRMAEIKAFSHVNLSLNDEMCRQTTGLRVDEVVEYWYEKFPWKNTTKKEVEEKIWESIIHLVKTEGTAKEGVYESLAFIKKQNVKLALASTSAMILINTVVEKLQLKDYFEVMCSAEFEKYGKPHPDIYISTAQQLNVHPSYCLAIEDSINGIIAAKAAKMKCIAIPDEILREDKRFGIADVTLSSLREINQALWASFTKS